VILSQVLGFEKHLEESSTVECMRVIDADLTPQRCAEPVPQRCYIRVHQNVQEWEPWRAKLLEDSKQKALARDLVKTS